MFPYYKGPQETRDLAYDDIMAMYELYSEFFYRFPSLRSKEYIETMCFCYFK